MNLFSSVQLLSRVRLFVTPWTAPHQASLSITSSRSLLTHVHHVGDAIQPPHPLSSIFPPTYTFPSFKVFSSESVLRIRWPKCWRFSFSISPSSEYSGLVSFRMSWLYPSASLRVLSTYHMPNLESRSSYSHQLTLTTLLCGVDAS